MTKFFEESATYAMVLFGWSVLVTIALWMCSVAFSRLLHLFKIFNVFRQWIVRRGRCVDCDKEWAWTKDKKSTS